MFFVIVRKLPASENAGPLVRECKRPQFPDLLVRRWRDGCLFRQNSLSLTPLFVQPGRWLSALAGASWEEFRRDGAPRGRAARSPGRLQFFPARHSRVSRDSQRAPSVRQQPGCGPRAARSVRTTRQPLKGVVGPLVQIIGKIREGVGSGEPRRSQQPWISL